MAKSTFIEMKNDDEFGLIFNIMSKNNQNTKILLGFIASNEIYVLENSQKWFFIRFTFEVKSSISKNTN